MAFRLADCDVIGFDLDMTLCRYRKVSVISDDRNFQIITKLIYLIYFFCTYLLKLRVEQAL